MRYMGIFLVIFCMMNIPFFAKANDSIASISQTGIILQKTDDISMKSEYLYISAEKVRVEYEFYNHSEHDIVTDVAFPMPELSFNEFQNDILSTSPEFKVWVNGKRVSYKKEGRAFLSINYELNGIRKQKNQEVTEKLKSLSLPLDYFMDVKDIDPVILQKLRTQGLYSDQNNDEEMRATYSLQPNYYWHQQFPAHKAVKIAHEYKARLGRNSINVPTYEEVWAKAFPNFITQDYNCYSLPAQDQEKRDGPCDKYGASYIDYILSTGSNWKGGIENFYFTVEGAAFFLIKMDNKIDAGIQKLTLYKKDFHPKSEITVEFFGIGQPPRIPPLFNITKKIDGPANCRRIARGKTTLTIPDNQTVSLLERNGDWYKVRYKGDTCWTHQKNLRSLL